MKAFNKTPPNIIFIVTIASLLFASCASRYDVSGCSSGIEGDFILGVIHGITLPFAFIVSALIDSNIGIYALNNNGVEYDLGYLIGIYLFKIRFLGNAFGQKLK